MANDFAHRELLGERAEADLLTHPRVRPCGTWRTLAAAALLSLLAAALPRQVAQAAPLSQSDLAIVLYPAGEGASGKPLGASALAGFFGPHRCLCPAPLLVQVQLTATGKANLGTSSMLAVDLRLGSGCLASPAACPSVGQVSFSGTQTAESPMFSSELVFRAAAGGAAVSCGALIAGRTTLWALLAQDGVALPFALSVDLPVTPTTLGAPTAVTAEPANQALEVTWIPPAESARVAAYQVLCLPRVNATFKAAYEACGLTAAAGAETLTPADATQLCSDALSASTTSTRITGLVNGTTYTVAVVAIDAGGGVSALSPTAHAVPQATVGFYEKYKQSGGAATGCALGRTSGGAAGLVLTLTVLLLLLLRRRGSRAGGVTVLVLLLGGGRLAQAQVARYHGSDDWAAKPSPQTDFVPVDWGLELGISLYRPAVDSELDGARPFADTFSNARRFMSELELVRYLGHGSVGSWGVGLRLGYYKNYADAFLTDGRRSGDETTLRLIPLALSAIYRVTEVPGVRRVLIPYVKAGLDGVLWTASSSGASGAESGGSLGWHVAGGLLLSLSFIAGSGTAPGAIAGPGAVFFEWDYAAINGLGLGDAMHVGDSTWYAGLMFDL